MRVVSLPENTPDSPITNDITYQSYHNESKGKLKMKQCKQAFTLIELLVVICIIAILASMLLPALQSARDSASSATCVSNLGQISKAFQMYVTSYDDFMPMLTDPQTGSTCGWVRALTDVSGQSENPKFVNSFFCESDTSGSPGSHKSYSLNNLMEVIHPRITYSIGPNGDQLTNKNVKLKGYISGNRTTAVFAASDLIIIGENVSTDNGLTAATVNPAGSTSSIDMISPGSASPVHQYVALKLRMSSHMTAGNLFLDGHVKHTNPEKTIPTKCAQFLMAYHTPDTKTIGDGKAGSLYSNSYPNGISTSGFGNWTDCIKGKLDNTNPITEPTSSGKTGKGSRCEKGDCHEKK